MIDIDYIINTFKDFGYRVESNEVPDLAFHMKQKWSNMLDIEERSDTSYNIHYGKRPYGDHNDFFSVFKVYEVHSNGKTYHDPNDFHYFYNAADISRIYHQREIEDLLDDLMNELVSMKVLSTACLREWKLNKIGI